jgi:hypothetical protein
MAVFPKGAGVLLGDTGTSTLLGARKPLDYFNTVVVQCVEATAWSLTVVQ